MKSGKFNSEYKCVCILTFFALAASDNCEEYRDKNYISFNCVVCGVTYVADNKKIIRSITPYSYTAYNADNTQMHFQFML